MRKAGILLPIFSLPSRHGIGTFGRSAYHFVDFLRRAGQSYWQVLPMGPTSYGDSPYQSFSTFAGNPYFIDPELLAEQGLLTLQECIECRSGSNPQYVDYERLYHTRFDLLRIAYERVLLRPELHKKIDIFAQENDFWLEDYALYMAIKAHFNGRSWQEWDEDIKRRESKAVAAYKQQYQHEMGFWCFLQYEFYRQWILLKDYANNNGIGIIGDLPIYVALDSADCWCNTELFQFDEITLTPSFVAGCPPDAFAATGQLWGNPLYNWKQMKQTGYDWWLRRIKHAFTSFNKVRIDHFRGFDEYYSIPATDTTAENGHWEPGPGYPFFAFIKEKLGELDIIAEDLGFLTETVYKLLEDTGYPGMKVLQFGFDASGASDYLPHKFGKNSVIYTGTHDNDTTLSWYNAQSVADRRFMRRYLGIRPSKTVSLDFIRFAYMSPCELAMIPIQDFLCLDGNARINFPSTLGFNWQWRLLPHQLTERFADRLYHYTHLYDRVPELYQRAPKIELKQDEEDEEIINETV